MTDFKPTEEQQEIIRLAKDTKENLLITALAGAAKTTTLVLIAKAIQNEMILCLAFNKKIALEMEKRLPGNCESLTLNSIGHRAWSRHIMKKLTLEQRKNFFLLKNIADDLEVKKAKERMYEGLSDMRRTLAFGKACGWVPDSVLIEYPEAKQLMDDETFFTDHAPFHHSAEEMGWLVDAMTESIDRSMRGTIDFDDQIYMPTLFGARFMQSRLVLVDEAQDLSNINHQMLHKIASKRVIAVGDQFQAIYGFRGAHADSMKKLKKEFDMTSAELSISFRCPQRIVEEARWRAPQMKWPNWAVEGEVRKLETWDVNTFPDGAAIICRNNAPLFTLAFAMIRNGRTPNIAGKDFIGPLIKTMKKFGHPDTDARVIRQEIAQWRDSKLARDRDSGAVNDQANCMLLFVDQGDTLGDAINHAEHLAACEGPLQLMTGHKSKGLEFDDVFILEKELLKFKDEEGEPTQDNNLLYVMQTRAKRTLTYIRIKGFMGDGE